MSNLQNTLWQYLTLMKEFISYPSISTDPQHSGDCAATAEYLVNLLRWYGFTADAITWYGNPIVVASYILNPNLSTYLVYGHYDVQPADIAEWWEQDPFDLQVTDEKIIARGAVDNKGQIMIHIATIGQLIQENSIGFNIKFMIEGDEETGSPYLEKFMHDYKDTLSCDWVVVSDGEIIGDHTPTIWAWFRGGCNMTLTLKTANVDLHSGLYGWIAPNSALEATKLLSKLYTTQHRLSIETYYSDTQSVTDEERLHASNIPFSEEDTKKTTGIRNLLVQEWYDPVTANGLMPTIQITGLQSGYTGDGYRNAIPHKTTIKLNFRFARGQNPTTAVEQFISRAREQLPEYVDMEIDISDPYAAITIQTHHEAVQRARDILGLSHSKEPVLRFCGAAIPVTGMFQDILGAWVAIVDLANDDCHMHGVWENFKISCIEKWLEFSKQFFQK